jgi:hypothetical protein
MDIPYWTHNYSTEFTQRETMEITTKIIEETSVKVPYEEEEHAILFLRNLGYTVTNFDHHEDYVKIIGQRTFEPKRGKHDNGDLHSN